MAITRSVKPIKGTFFEKKTDLAALRFGKQKHLGPWKPTYGYQRGKVVMGGW